MTRSAREAAKIIAIANQKGGVGKTTTSINLSASLAAARRRVLLVDIDAQGNATTGSGIDKETADPNIYQVLLEDVPIADVVQRAKSSGYDVLPANADLTAARVGLMELPRREHRLRRKIDAIRDDYDYILIDCPPALDMLTVNALVAAQTVLIPMQCEYFALEGLSDLVETIDAISRSANSELRLEGLLRTMVDPRNRLTREVSDQLIEHFGDRVYRTIIPRNVRLAEAPSFGMPIFEYDRNSKGATAYLALAGEFIRRHSAGAEANDAPSNRLSESTA